MPVTIAVDFDGTIAEHRYPDIGAEVPEAMETLRELKQLGCKLILWTMRSDSSKDGPTLTQAVEWCRARGVEFDHVNHNPSQARWTSSPKVYAQMYIDDAAAGTPLRESARAGGRPVVDWATLRPIIFGKIAQLNVRDLPRHDPPRPHARPHLRSHGVREPGAPRALDGPRQREASLAASEAQGEPAVHIVARNAHQMLPEVVYQLKRAGVRRNSRNGPVLVIPTPVILEYLQPRERVLFWTKRDANPFFHLMESLWMLAGRNDVAFPLQFNSTFGQFSDDGKTFNGAYGNRWRRWFGLDQLEIIAQRLRENPDDRRCVLSMWDGSRDLGSDSKDVPCNLSVSFQRDADGRLDMTVFNRSNDAVWGALGANVVHFSFLQEFLALCIGCPVGRYFQISANLHGYEKTFTPLEELADYAFPSDLAKRSCPYEKQHVAPVPLGASPDETSAFLSDTQMFCDEGTRALGYRTKFFRRLVLPLAHAWAIFKSDSPHRHDQAISYVNATAVNCDWSEAAIQWLGRRKARADQKAAEAKTTEE